MTENTWTCQRSTDGKKCGHVNPKRKQICEQCGKKRAPTKPPAHKHVLRVFPYKTWVIFFGERCGICGREPTKDSPLCRDHEHRVVPGELGGGMRGLLCFLCNKQLPYWAKLEWMEMATDYVRRASGRPDG